MQRLASQAHNLKVVGSNPTPAKKSKVNIKEKNMKNFVYSTFVYSVLTSSIYTSLTKYNYMPGVFRNTN